ncbi:hypothetical protein ABPG74_003911 [Tetrahymena malaccensis]
MFLRRVAYLYKGFQNTQKQSFSFFNNQISDKYGKKCCRYHQDGKPLAPQKVEQIKNSISDFVKGWNLNEDKTRLIRYFYIEDYIMAVQFLKDVAKIDALNFQNCPSFSLQKGELLTLELYSPPLNGLSQLDFQLAMKINEMNLDEYFLIPIEKPEDYKRQVQMAKMKKQNELIQKQLEDDFNKINNKFQKEQQA